MSERSELNPGAVDLDSRAALAPLFTPQPIGRRVLRNRFVMPGMQRGWTHEGAPTDDLAGYYRRRAEGEVAMIIGESAAIDHPSATQQPAACRLNARTAAAWAFCAEGVRAAGSEFLVQLWHEGALRDPADGNTLSPSGSAYRGHQGGRAATLGELAEIRDAYVAGARLAQQVGASGVEVHACHGYFLDQFLWAVTNTRTDGYGGPDIAQRARFPAEIVAAIRAACGADFLISFRFSQYKQHDYEAKIAATPEELATLLQALRAAGVDVFHASTRRFWLPAFAGSARSFAGWTRHLGGLPTIAVGSVGLSLDVMESFTGATEAQSTVADTAQRLIAGLAAGDFDLVAVGRSLIADPDFVRKLREGREAEIRVFRKEQIAFLEKWERPHAPRPRQA